VINPLLAVLGQDDLVIYFAANTIAYLAITLLYMQFNPKVRRALNLVSAVYFAVFLIAITFKVVSILFV
jgi:hypothetical protein